MTRPQPAQAAMRPHCLSLSDRQLQLVKAAAASVPVQHRDAFLKQIADQLRGDPVRHRCRRRHQHRARSCARFRQQHNEQLIRRTHHGQTQQV